MSSKTSAPSRLTPVRTRTSHDARRAAWKLSSRLRTRRTGRPVRSAANATSGSSLACCLPPNPPPGSGAKTRTFESGRPRTLASHLLEPVRVLDRAPDGDSVAVGSGHERVRLDREVGDHRERVRVLDDDVGERRVDIAPADLVLAEDVGRREAIGGAQGRFLDERGRRVEGRRQGEDGGQLLVLDVDQAGGQLGRVLRLGRHDRHRLAVVLRLAIGDDGAISELWTEARDGPGQVRGRHDQAHARDRERLARVDRDDAGPRRSQRDELRVRARRPGGCRRRTAGAPVTRPIPPTRLGEVPMRVALIARPAPRWRGPRR